MHPTTSLEARIATLERSLRRSRAKTGALGLAAVVVAAGAFVQQSTPPWQAQMEERLESRLQSALAERIQEQAQERLATQRLALTNELNVELVVLQGASDGSLLVLTPDGVELLRLGGPMVRRIEH